MHDNIFFTHFLLLAVFQKDYLTVNGGYRQGK